MTTDEMILALVATGKFTLPPGIKDGRGIPRCPPLGYWMHGPSNAGMLDQQAHDLCAMHFARRLEHVTSIHADQFRVYIGVGNSAAAIKALYEAMKERG